MNQIIGMRDLMSESLDKRFGDQLLATPVQCSAYTAEQARLFARPISLQPVVIPHVQAGSSVA